MTMYPFVPTKASEIKEGDYYYIPLSNGYFACGRLLRIEKKSGRKTKSILVCLHDWTGENHPINNDIHKSPILEQGVIHIDSIKHIGSQIIGYKALDEDNLKPLLQFEAGYLLDGFETIGQLPTQDYNKYSRRSTYGLSVMQLLAEKHFVKSSQQIASAKLIS